MNVYRVIFSFFLAFSLFLGTGYGQAAEFTNDYQLSYPDLNVNINMGIVHEDEWIGFDENIPINSEIPLCLDDQFQELIDHLNSMDEIPLEMRNLLIQTLYQIFSQVIENYLEIGEFFRGYLPKNMSFNQMFQPMNQIIWISFEELPIPWPGRIHPENGTFDLQTMILPIEQMSWKGWEIQLTTILLGNGRINRENDYDATGTFRLNGELVIDDGEFTIFAGIGTVGDWHGRCQ